MFINISPSKLTDYLIWFPLGRVPDMTVDLTFRVRSLRQGACVFCVNVHMSACLIGTRQSKNSAKQLCLFYFVTFDNSEAITGGVVHQVGCRWETKSRKVRIRGRNVHSRSL